MSVFFITICMNSHVCMFLGRFEKICWLCTFRPWRAKFTMTKLTCWTKPLFHFHCIYGEFFIVFLLEKENWHLYVMENICSRNFCWASSLGSEHCKGFSCCLSVVTWSRYLEKKKKKNCSCNWTAGRVRQAMLFCRVCGDVCWVTWHPEKCQCQPQARPRPCKCLGCGIGIRQKGTKRGTEKKCL